MSEAQKTHKMSTGNTAKGSSKLQESLAQALGAKPVLVVDDDPQGLPDKDPDPFEQAGSNTKPFETEEQVPNEFIGPAEKEESLDLDLPDDIPSVLVTPAPPKRIDKAVRPKLNKAGTVVTGVALLLSVAATGMAGYTMSTLGGVEQRVAQSVDGLYESVGALNTDFVGLKIDLSTTKEGVAGNEQKIDKFGSLAEELRGAVAELKTLQSEVAQLSLNNKEDRSLLESFGGQLKGFGDKLKKFTTKPKRQKKVVKRHKVIRDDDSKVQGATLASIDTWGASTSVMLRDESQRWVAMNLGDTYKGWHLTEVKDGVAHFSKGNKSRELKVEG